MFYSHRRVFCRTISLPSFNAKYRNLPGHFFQNRAAKVITRSSYDTSASILLNRFNWDNLSTRRKKLKATLMFKIIKGLSPEYLQDLFSIRSTP